MEKIKLYYNLELIKRKLPIKELKTIIKDRTGIKEENQRFNIWYEPFSTSDLEFFFDDCEILIYDITNYKACLERDVFKEMIALDLNKTVGELKKIVFEQTKVPIDRIEFYLNLKKLPDNKILKDENLFKNKLFLRISEQLTDLIYVKINSEIKEIKTDLYNTGIELMQQFQKEPIIAESSFNMKYNAIYKNKQINYSNLLINLGINGNKSGDLIEINIRDNFPIIIKTIFNKTLTIMAQKSDEVKLIKHFISLVSGYPIEKQRLILEGKLLKDEATLDQCNIGKDSILNLVLPLGRIA